MGVSHYLRWVSLLSSDAKFGSDNISGAAFIPMVAR
jgi:hypothetical protein